MSASDHEILTRINALDDDFGFWAWTPKVLDEAAIRACEAALGIPFPADYLAFVRAHGCAAVQAKPEVWARPEAYAVGPLWAHEYGFEIYGIADGVPPPLDVRERHAALAKRGITDLLPLAGLMGRSALLACDRDGQLVWLERDGREPLAGTFTEAIAARIDQLAADKPKAKAAGAALWS